MRERECVCERETHYACKHICVCMYVHVRRERERERERERAERERNVLTVPQHVLFNERIHEPKYLHAMRAHTHVSNSVYDGRAPMLRYRAQLPSANAAPQQDYTRTL